MSEQPTPTSHSKVAMLLSNVLESSANAAQKLREFNGWIADILHTKVQWVIGVEIFGLIGLGLTMVQVDEYAVADFFWVLGACIWMLKALDSQRPPWFKGVNALLGILVCTVLIVWTNTRRGDKPWSNFTGPKRSEELTGFMQLAGVNVVTKLLAENEPISLNVGFTMNGAHPISDVYLFEQAAIADYHKKPDEKTEREAEEYLHKTFDEEIPKQERLIAEQKLKGQAIGVGVGVLWRTVKTSPLTKEQVSGLVSGESRLYLMTWNRWKDSRDHSGKLITCTWLQAPASTDLSREQMVWHLCQWW